VLSFYQQKEVFAKKYCPRPNNPKWPMKANKGQQSSKLQITLHPEELEIMRGQHLVSDPYFWILS
jgi:hypothetical protein